jgi:GntR family transcriptional repressor for pyruvate dehydrogenase complex
MQETPINLPSFKRDNLVEMVFETLKGKILEGEFKDGDRLPTQEDLCQQFGVSRTVMRGALHKLSSLGLIESYQGRGTFVCHPKTKTMLEPLLVNALLLDKPTTRELIETRYYLERVIVRLAAKHIDDKQAEVLQDLVRQMDRNFQEGNIEAFSEGDLAFHIKLAEISKNSILKRLIEVIREMLAKFLDEFNRTPGAAERANEHHRKICDAVVRHDADSAEKGMQLHLRDVMTILHDQHHLDVEI